MSGMGWNTGRMVMAGAGLALLAACAQSPFEAAEPEAVEEAPDAAPVDTVAVAPPPPPAARTEEQFDTTTAEQRAAAADPEPEAGERLLGTTIASLGDPTQPGFWIKTPLVSAPGKGRVVFPGSGKSAEVDLIPIEGEPGAGSRLSLAAMRLIEAPLTDLPSVEVYGL